MRISDICVLPEKKNKQPDGSYLDYGDADLFNNGWNKAIEIISNLEVKLILEEEKMANIIYSHIGGELAEEELRRQLGISGRTVTELEAMSGAIKSKAVFLAQSLNSKSSEFISKAPRGMFKD